jgi:hypothetical protein
VNSLHQRRCRGFSASCPVWRTNFVPLSEGSIRPPAAARGPQPCAFPLRFARCAKSRPHFLISRGVRINPPMFPSWRTLQSPQQRKRAIFATYRRVSPVFSLHGEIFRWVPSRRTGEERWALTCPRRWVPDPPHALRYPTFRSSGYPLIAEAPRAAYLQRSQGGGCKLAEPPLVGRLVRSLSSEAESPKARTEGVGSPRVSCCVRSRTPGLVSQVGSVPRDHGDQNPCAIWQPSRVEGSR